MVQAQDSLTMNRKMPIFLTFLTASTLHVAFALINLNHNPNCLLMTSKTQLIESTEITKQHDDHLSSAHQNSIVVQRLNSNEANSNNTPLWKTCCIEIVIFYDGENILSFYGNLFTWAYQGNAVIYMVFSSEGYHIWKTEHISLFLQFSVPIYLIILDFREQLSFTKLFNPTNIFEDATWQIYPIESGNMFPKAEELIKSRRLLDSNQNLFKLAINKNEWVYPLEQYDCEDHRYFLINDTYCFVAFGPLQVVRRKLNFTFSSKW